MQFDDFSKRMIFLSIATVTVVTFAVGLITLSSNERSSLGFQFTSALVTDASMGLAFDSISPSTQLDIDDTFTVNISTAGSADAQVAAIRLQYDENYLEALSIQEASGSYIGVYKDTNRDNTSIATADVAKTGSGVFTDSEIVATAEFRVTSIDSPSTEISVTTDSQIGVTNQLGQYGSLTVNLNTSDPAPPPPPPPPPDPSPPPPEGETALYRFWSTPKQTHFYTISRTERDKLINFDPDWDYETISYYVQDPDICNDGNKPVYRFWSQTFQSHFYTMDEDEAIKLAYFDPNWSYERVAFCANPYSGDGRIPVYRFYSVVYKSHFFTISETERDKLIYNDPNWAYEGVAYYAFN